MTYERSYADQPTRLQVVPGSGLHRGPMRSLPDRWLEWAARWQLIPRLIGVTLMCAGFAVLNWQLERIHQDNQARICADVAVRIPNQPPTPLCSQYILPATGPGVLIGTPEPQPAPNGPKKPAR